MPIVFNKLFELMEKKNVKVFYFRKNKIIGTESLEKMRKGEGHIDTRTIEKLCKALDCQPADIMEYIPDDTDNENCK